MEFNEDLSTKNIQEHSKRVKQVYISCIALMVLGVLIILVPLIINSTKEEYIENILADSSEMIAPQYKGQTGDGQDFVITSDKATELDDGVILLNSPVANLLETTDWSNFILDSVSGVYDNNEKILTLTDNVELDDNKGNSLKASEISLDLEKNIIYSNNKIDLTGEIGKITADGLEIKDEGNVIIFKGKSKMIINDTEE